VQAAGDLMAATEKSVFVSRKLPGYLTREHTIWCHKCMHWETRSGREENVITVARQLGWVLGRNKAMCPTCAAAQRTAGPSRHATR
jgi:hypothetical protein